MNDIVSHGMNSISQLLNPRSVAIVGASPRGNRGGRTLVNLRETGFKGDVFAINPRYEEVLGFPSYSSVDALPAPVDCIMLAIGAEAACETLEKAFARGIRAAVVLAAGFGEGGHNQARAERLRHLGKMGMSICGPNCFGLLSIKDGAPISVYSGRLPKPLISGNVAFVSQSGGLAMNAFTPLMSDRQVGFRYIVSCGNQIATTVEDYIEAFVDDPDVDVVAAIVESIGNPRKLQRVARQAHARGKRMIFFHVGQSNAGQKMTRSHTGALVGDSTILAAFLRRCGIVCADGFDEFVEAIELFSATPLDGDVAHQAMVICGSGGGAAIAADTLSGVGLDMPAFEKASEDRIQANLPEFATVTNPLDGTGSMAENPAVLESVLAVIAAEKSGAMIAVAVNAKQVASPKDFRFSEIVAQAARTSNRKMIAFQASPLSGPLEPRIVNELHSAHVPLLLGNSTAMRVLPYLPLAHDYRIQALGRDWSEKDWHASGENGGGQARPESWDFLTARKALVESGVNIVEAHLAASESEAVSIFHKFGCPVALKAEAQGLLHKSDVGCVRLNSANEAEVIAAFRSVTENARQAGFHAIDGVLIQPMMSGLSEAYAGVINDPVFGPAICVGLGGVFVEIFKDTITEVAPLSQADAIGMIKRLKAAPILLGARGRPAADIDALAELLVRLSRFSLANADRFRAIDLNPIIVREAGQGVVAVDIAVEPIAGTDQVLTSASR